MRRSSHARPTRVERLVGGAAALWRCGGRAVEARGARRWAARRGTATEAEAAVVAEHLAELLALLLLEVLALRDDDRLVARRDDADVVADLDVGDGRLRLVADDGRVAGDRDGLVLVVQLADRLVDDDVVAVDRLDRAAVGGDGREPGAGLVGNDGLGVDRRAARAEEARVTAGVTQERAPRHCAARALRALGALARGRGAAGDPGQRADEGTDGDHNPDL